MRNLNPTMPVLLTTQCHRALGDANDRRSATAHVKRKLRDHSVNIGELIQRPPAELERQMIWKVLMWAPGIGHRRLRELNARAMRHGYVNLAAPLGSLTDRQRGWLVNELTSGLR